MATLVRRFVCGTCGGTSAYPGCPFQRCTSCNTISGYDFGVARTLPDWPAHEARLGTRFSRHAAALAAASRHQDKRAYATAYEGILRPVIQEFPSLYPPAASDPAYLDHLVAFYGAWQAQAAIDPAHVQLDGEYRRRRDAVERRGELAVPGTLWPLIDTALAVADLQARLCAADPGPPPDFIATFVRRFSLAITAAEWLPQLDAAGQRALVERLGVSAQYAAPAEQTVTCGNCGGDVAITPGFLAMACPYCSAEIQEARPDYRPVEADRASFGMTEHGIKLAIQRAEQPLAHLALLDGPVTRDGQPFRFMVLRACFAAGPARDTMTILEAPDSPLFADMLAWVDAYTTDTDVTCRTLAYREHPHCHDRFPSAAAIDQRLADLTPDTAAAIRSVAMEGSVTIAEATAGGTVLRLAHTESSSLARLIEAWARG